MTLEELDVLLQSLDYPVAYYQFKDEQELPYIAYLVSNKNPFNADNKTYHEGISVDIELYVEEKSPSIEKRLEELLKENKLPWSYGERFIESEGVFQCLYSITLI